jgi:hypothetical protein
VVSVGPRPAHSVYISNIDFAQNTSGTIAPVVFAMFNGSSLLPVFASDLNSMLLSASWERSATGVGSWTPVSNSYQLTLSNLDAGTHYYRLKLINDSMNAEIVSNVATVTVAASAPTILSQPQNVSIAEGSAASFLVAAQGTGPLTYQWQESADGNSWIDLASTNSSVLTLSSVTSAQNAYFYRVRVSNLQGAAISDAAQLTVTGGSCSLPENSQGGASPILASPTAMATDVSLLPTLSWEAMQAAPACALQYELQLSLQSNFSEAITLSLNGTSSTMNSYLLAETPYFWRVRAKAGDSSWTPYAQSSFTTTSADVSAPTDLFTMPYTTPERPAGNKQILLGAFNGERFATGIFYLKRAEGDVEVGRTTIGDLPGGRFEVSIDVTQYSQENGAREFYARQQRPGSTTLGPVSARSVIYYYEANQSSALTAPVLERASSTIGALKWAPVENATAYLIYRRIGITDTNDAIYQGQNDLEFYNNGVASTPFLKVATITEINLVNGRIEWTDLNVPQNLNDHGVSYFVVAEGSNNAISPRSNSQTFEDSIAPKRSREVEAGVYKQQITFNETGTGRSAAGFLCNINDRGFFHRVNSDLVRDFYETSPDMVAQVQVKLKADGIACADEDFNQAAQSRTFVFDALSAFGGDDLATQSCLFVGEVNNLEPAQTYCFKTCLRDLSGNSEGDQCIDAAAFNSGTDTTAPDFAGITEATPLDDGKSIEVQWNPPVLQDQTQEPITYLVQYTANFDANGLPLFSETDDVREADRSATSLTVDRLSTDTRYCFVVEAVDDFDNSSDTKNYLCSSTLNNKPQVEGLRMVRDEIEANRVLLNFRVIDRTQDRVNLVSMKYRVTGFTSWIDVNDRHLSGNTSGMISGNSFDTAPQQSIEFDTLAYFSGQRDGFQLQLTLSDTEGNMTIVETDSMTAFSAQSRNSASVRGVGACSVNANASSSSTSGLILCLLIAFGLGLLQIQRRALAKTK